MSCWFAQFSDKRCDGFYERAHLIPQQRLRRAGIGAIAADSRSWRPGCKLHHHLFDAKAIRLNRDDYPATFLEFADQHGLYFDGPDGGWKVAA